MTLDLNTLFLVTIYVEAILGLLLLFAWVQNTQIRAVAWWGSAHLVRATSVVLFGMYGAVPDAISIDLANAILFLASSEASYVHGLIMNIDGGQVALSSGHTAPRDQG